LIFPSPKTANIKTISEFFKNGKQIESQDGVFHGQKREDFLPKTICLTANYNTPSSSP